MCTFVSFVVDDFYFPGLANAIVVDDFYFPGLANTNDFTTMLLG